MKVNNQPLFPNNHALFPINVPFSQNSEARGFSHEPPHLYQIPVETILLTSARIVKNRKPTEVFTLLFFCNRYILYLCRKIKALFMKELIGRKQEQRELFDLYKSFLK